VAVSATEVIFFRFLSKLERKMIRQKNAWTCIPASGYDFPTTRTTTTTAASRSTNQKSKNDTACHKQDGGTDDIDKDLKHLLLGTADPDQEEKEEEAKDEGETKEDDVMDTENIKNTITIQYRHYEARLPINGHSASESPAVTTTTTGGGSGRLARLSAVVAESEWKASQDDWASMRVVPEPIDGPNAGVSTAASIPEEPAGPATQKRLEVRNQKQIQKMQRRGSMTMKLVHKGKKAISKQAKKTKIRERAKKAANILTSSSIFKRLVDTAYVHCCEAAADNNAQQGKHDLSLNNSNHSRGQVPQSIRIPSKASTKRQGSLRDLNSSFRSLIGGGSGGGGGQKRDPTEQELHRKRLAAEGHIGPTELYAGLLWVHVQLARYLGVAALYPPERSVVYDLFLISDVDDSGGIDRDEFNLIAKTTCAQIMGRLGVVYAARFIVFPILSQWLIMYFLPFSSFLPRVVRTVLEQVVASFLFMILIPVWFGLIDEQSCVSAERKATKAIERRKRKETQRELKRFQSSNSSGNYGSAAAGDTAAAAATPTTSTSVKVATTSVVLETQREISVGAESDEAIDDENDVGIGDATAIEVEVESNLIGCHVGVGADTPTVEDSTKQSPKQSIPRKHSVCSSSSSNEGSIDIAEESLDSIGDNAEVEGDGDESEEEESDMDDSLDEEEYEDSSDDDDDDDGDYDSDVDDGIETSSRGGYMSVHSRPTPDSSNSDMSTHHGDLGASANAFDNNDDDNLEPSDRGNEDDVIDALAINPLFRQNSSGEYLSESSNIDEDGVEEEDSLGFTEPE